MGTLAHDLRLMGAMLLGCLAWTASQVGYVTHAWHSVPALIVLAVTHALDCRWIGLKRRLDNAAALQVAIVMYVLYAGACLAVSWLDPGRVPIAILVAEVLFAPMSMLTTRLFRGAIAGALPRSPSL